MKKKTRKIMQMRANNAVPYSQSLQSLDSVPSLGWFKDLIFSLSIVGVVSLGVRVGS
jgi:hypothetical protein